MRYARAISGTVIQYRQEKRAAYREGRAATRGPTGAVAPRGQRGNRRRQRRRPLQNTNGSGGGGRCIKRGAAKSGCYRKRAAAMSAAVTVTETGQPLQAAVTGSGRRPRRRPLLKQCPEAGYLNAPEGTRHTGEPRAKSQEPRDTRHQKDRRTKGRGGIDTRGHTGGPRDTRGPGGNHGGPKRAGRPEGNHRY
jgi:hypothetical protein